MTWSESQAVERQTAADGGPVLIGLQGCRLLWLARSGQLAGRDRLLGHGDPGSGW